MSKIKNKQSQKKDQYFDQEDKQWSEYIENTELTPMSARKRKEMTGQLSQAAKNTLSKNRTVSLRLSERDLMKLKQKAAAEGMPYQTLIASILHKHVYYDEE